MSMIICSLEWSIQLLASTLPAADRSVEQISRWSQPRNNQYNLLMSLSRAATDRCREASATE